MHIDLNSDSGESFSNWALGDDAAMMQLVTSANIACGFHAGDPTVMRRTCELAAANNVTIGAHVSYQDLANFGRVFHDVAPADLTALIVYQLGALSALAHTTGSKIRYIKPHGALYNTIVHHQAHARAVVDAVRTFDTTLPILCLPNSVIYREAEAAGLRSVVEAFADRAYTPEGTLVSRREQGAVITDPQQAADRMVRLVTEGEIEAIDGSTVSLHAESICVHGDTPSAVALARTVATALQSAGISLRSFV